MVNELDENAKDTWLFPVRGFEKRDYQLNISKSAIFNNTLVLLPTGLGKTFIASVVIYNFLRWFPQSKIVFMVILYSNHLKIFKVIDEIFNYRHQHDH